MWQWVDKQVLIGSLVTKHAFALSGVNCLIERNIWIMVFLTSSVEGSSSQSFIGRFIA